MSSNIRDVAAAAGVSVTTVSHVLNKQGRVAAETRKRVEKVAAELGYRANVHAQQLVTRRSRTIAIQVSRPQRAGKSAMMPNSEYFLEVLNGAAEAADERGYALILTPPGVSAEAVEAFGVDGAIIVDPQGDEPLFESRWNATRRLVTTGRPRDGTQHPFTVDNDHAAATVAMMEHLQGAGYRRPAVVVSDTSRSYIRDIIQGYHGWCSLQGIKPVVTKVEQRADGSTGGSVIRDLLVGTSRPDAIYMDSEELALDLFHQARGAGLRIPDDLALCSAVDSNWLRLTSPSVTGMFLFPRDIGRRATNLVIELLQAPSDAADVRVEVPTRLEARASTRGLSTNVRD